MRNITILFFAFLLSGCASAELTQKNYDPKGGVVSVTGNMGRESAINKAHDLMTSFCAPQGYKLVSESNGQVHSGTQFNNYGGTVYATPMSKKNTDLTFLCK